VYGAPAQSIAGSNALVLSFSLVEQFGCSLVASLYYRIVSNDESIGLINIMLVGHLTLKVTLINELMLLLCLASSLTAVKSKASLSATACIGPGTLCTQGLTWTLTGPVIFRLFQQHPP